MVIATQNPFDFEGTYLLPENQLDRFLMRISLGYPGAEEEARILDVRPANHPLHELRPVLTRAEVLDLQERVDKVTIDRALLDYIVQFANATRKHPGLQHGLSPRGSLSLAQAARATALFHGRDYVVPDDIVDNILPVCTHRIVTRSAATSGPDSPEQVLQSVLESVPSPA
jgi:MoxR-like ATPase